MNNLRLFFLSIALLPLSAGKTMSGSYETQKLVDLKMALAVEVLAETLKTVNNKEEKSNFSKFIKEIVPITRRNLIYQGSLGGRHTEYCGELAEKFNLFFPSKYKSTCFFITSLFIQNGGSMLIDFGITRASKLGPIKNIIQSVGDKIPNEDVKRVAKEAVIVGTTYVVWSLANYFFIGK